MFQSILLLLTGYFDGQIWIVRIEKMANLRIKLGTIRRCCYNLKPNQLSVFPKVKSKTSHYYARVLYNVNCLHSLFFKYNTVTDTDQRAFFFIISKMELF